MTKQLNKKNLIDFLNYQGTKDLPEELDVSICNLVDYLQLNTGLFNDYYNSQLTQEDKKDYYHKVIKDFYIKRGIDVQPEDFTLIDAMYSLCSMISELQNSKEIK